MSINNNFMTNLKNALRTPAALEPIETVTLAQVASELHPVNVRLATHNATGNEYLQFVDKDDNYLSVKIGAKVITEATGAERVKEIMNNFIIYTGASENGQWFTFGPKPTERKVIEVSFAELMKSGAVTLAK
jgi:hypothetical protein